MRLFVLGNANRPGVTKAAERLLPFLKEHAQVVVFDLHQEIDLSQETADIALVFGGDGAILRAARQMGYRQIPVLGVNLGKLGFLAALNLDQFEGCFPHVARGNYQITHHVMLECTFTSPALNQTVLGLNDVVVHTGRSYHVIDLNLFVDGEPVTRYSGDGLILSTPIGSTAHNLSAGGPILGQELEAFVITPICSHTLTNRPVVDSSEKVYTIVLTSGWGDAVLIVDGQEITPFNTDGQVTVRRAPVTFGLVKVPGRGYYQTLRDKLHWGQQPNYRAEPRTQE